METKLLANRDVSGGGFVKIVDYLGNDATVVNAARVSFGKQVTEIREQDVKLLNFLASEGHTSPFRHVYVQFHVRAPEFVARQWYKHVVGSEYGFKDQPWNEISGRYVEYDLETYIPTTLRAQSTDRKQGSSKEPLLNHDRLLKKFKEHVDNSMEFYKFLCDQGVAKEQARMVIPMNFFTEWYWTASLQAAAHFVSLRTEEHAQLEIQGFATALDECVSEIFPHAWKALKG